MPKTAPVLPAPPIPRGGPTARPTSGPRLTRPAKPTPVARPLTGPRLPARPNPARKGTRQEEEEANRLTVEGDYLRRLRTHYQTLTSEVRNTEQQYRNTSRSLSEEKADQLRNVMDPGLSEVHKTLLRIEEKLRQREGAQWEAELALTTRIARSRAFRRTLLIELAILAVIAAALWFLFR
ncbi:MAG: hypothetical protein SFU56_07030 [Capsulimonadales bacterium]|nr:hypothetical protein [Capsulimonadales bacterium]